MSDIVHFSDYSYQDANIDIKINFSVLGNRLNKAQYWLDNEILTDMLPYMPLRTGTLRNRTIAANQSLAGTGKVVAAVGPYGRFLYMGKVMVDPVTGSPWARKGAKKVVTDRDLTFEQPRAEAFWFNAAKRDFGDHWIDGVTKILTGEV